MRTESRAILFAAKLRLRPGQSLFFVLLLLPVYTERSNEGLDSL